MSCKYLFLSFLIIILNSFLYLNAIDSDSFEIKYTPRELHQMGKWKDRNLNDMVHDAFQGDEAALYMVGMGYLTGITGWAIDTEKADIFFAKSASLGFAPSVRQVLFKNLEQGNPFLVLVYGNLLASFGHDEFVVPYHDLRKRLIENFGEGVAKEIEKIATAKKDLIAKNQMDLKNSKDKLKFMLKMKSQNRLIDHNDQSLSSDEYWYQFSKFQIQANKETSDLKLLLENNWSDFTNSYELCRKNLSSAIDMWEKIREISPDLQTVCLKDAKKTIRKAKNLKMALCNYHLNSNLGTFVEDISLLCEYVEEVLDLQCSFFSSPHEFIEKEDSLKQLVECMTKLNAQSAYIQEIYIETTSF